MADKRDSRNYGHGRHLDSIVTRQSIAETVREYSGNGSASERTVCAALGQLAEFAREELGTRDLEALAPENMQEFTEWYSEKLAEGEISRSQTSTYISALNAAWMSLGRPEMTISAKEHNLERGAKYTNLNLSNTAEAQLAVREAILERYERTGDIRYASLAHSIELQEAGGLRLRESLCIKLADKDLGNDTVDITRGDGAKNNREREISSPSIDAFQQAQQFVREHAEIYSRGSLIPGNMTYQQQRNFAYNTIREIRNELNLHDYHYHGNRHAFAQDTYADKWEARTGARIEAPVVEGRFGSDHIRSISERLGISHAEAREMDKEIRQEVSSELGHERIEITKSYLGS